MYMDIGKEYIPKLSLKRKYCEDIIVNPNIILDHFSTITFPKAAFITPIILIITLPNIAPIIIKQVVSKKIKKLSVKKNKDKKKPQIIIVFERSFAEVTLIFSPEARSLNMKVDAPKSNKATNAQDAIPIFHSFKAKSSRKAEAKDKEIIIANP